MRSAKVVLLGDKEAGKTALFNKFMSYDPDEEYQATLGISSNSKVLNEVQFTLSDVRAGSLPAEITDELEDTDFLLLLVDSQTRNSMYIQEKKQIIIQSQANNSEMKCYLVYSKWDGDVPQEEITDRIKGEIEKLGISLAGTFKCSANTEKVNFGVKRLFEKLSEKVLPLEEIDLQGDQNRAEPVKSSFFANLTCGIFPCCPKKKGGDTERTPLIVPEKIDASPGPTSGGD